MTQPLSRHCCPDEDLLLLLHGQLGLLRRTAALRHVGRCPTCGRRLQQMLLASRIAAEAFGDPGAALSWLPSPAGAEAAAATVGAAAGGAAVGVLGGTASWLVPGLVAAILAVLLLFGVLVTRTLHSRGLIGGTPGAGQRAPVDEEPCRPGLPNDHCR